MILVVFSVRVWPNGRRHGITMVPPLQSNNQGLSPI